jgi:SnoaL-like domain
MTHEELQEWLDRYIEAWKSYDPDEIGALYSEGVVCRYHAYDEPIIGRDAVIRSWTGEGKGAPERDEPGTWEAEYRPFAIDGDAAVATGRTSYRDEPGGELRRTYFNCFVMRFDDDGRCREFTEWFMLPPDA